MLTNSLNFILVAGYLSESKGTITMSGQYAMLKEFCSASTKPMGTIYRGNVRKAVQYYVMKYISYEIYPTQEGTPTNFLYFIYI